MTYTNPLTFEVDWTKGTVTQVTTIKHLFARQSAIVAMCGAVDRTPKTDEENVAFEDLPTDGTVCTQCIDEVVAIREGR